MLFCILTIGDSNAILTTNKEVVQWVESITTRKFRGFERPPEESFVGVAMAMLARGWQTKEQLLEALPVEHRAAFAAAVEAKEREIEESSQRLEKSLGIKA